MQYIKIDDDTYIQFNEITKQSQTISKSELEKEASNIGKRINEDIVPSDEELLAWAKKNFPITDHSEEQGELDRINIILGAIEEI